MKDFIKIKFKSQLNEEVSSNYLHPDKWGCLKSVIAKALARGNL